MGVMWVTDATARRDVSIGPDDRSWSALLARADDVRGELSSCGDISALDVNAAATQRYSNVSGYLHRLTGEFEEN